MNFVTERKMAKVKVVNFYNIKTVSIRRLRSLVELTVGLRPWIPSLTDVLTADNMNQYTATSRLRIHPLSVTKKLVRAACMLRSVGVLLFSK